MSKSDRSCHGGVSPRLRSLATAALASAIWAVGCSDDITDPESHNAVDSAPMLSDTASRTSAVLSGTFYPGWRTFAVATAAQTGESNPNVAYISLPPGTAPNGVTALIHHERTGTVITVPLVGGGFDPVPIPAVPGDEIQLSVRAADGTTVLHYVRNVPGQRPPKVVRTSPPKGKRDVALNATIVIVFSEPVDASTVNETSIRLSHNGLAVAGTVNLLDAAQLTAVFTPAVPLAASTDYQLVVTEDVRDLDGEPVEAPVTVSFTTAGSGDTPLAGRIAFSNLASISVINPDATGFKTLVDGGRGWEYRSPTWSPDGSRIAFASNRDGNWNLFVMEADGSWVTPLTRGTGSDDQPAWSPDGARIAFESDRDGDFDIYLMNSDGSDAVNLTNGPAEDRGPAWSPDGTRIVFSSNGGLHVINANGTGLRRLTLLTTDTAPDWSPDGRRLLFSRSGLLHIMTTDGRLLRVLNVAGDGARWTPDGNRIVFSNWSLFVINADGSGLRNLNVYGFDPVWSVIGAP
jgi:hypothetical protein